MYTDFSGYTVFFLIQVRFVKLVILKGDKVRIRLTLEPQRISWTRNIKLQMSITEYVIRKKEYDLR